jgi:sugar lactone lactonase YvrE
MFDFDLATVTIGNREHLIEFRDGPGVPDGMAVDAQGLSFALTRVLRGFRSVNSEDS